MKIDQTSSEFGDGCFSERQDGGAIATPNTII
jgi:hypothetical protein